MSEAPDNSPDSSRDLWHAVIKQALQDAVSNNASTPAELERHQARRWLTVPNRDFTTVCEFAGEEPDQVRALAVKLIAEADEAPLNLCGTYLTGRRPVAPTSTPAIPALAANPLSRPTRVSTARRHRPPIKRPTKSFTLNGETLTAHAWAARLGISAPALFNRIASGWPLERALTEVISTRSQNHRNALKRNKAAREQRSG